jgi:hypothetical protein
MYWSRGFAPAASAAFAPAGPNERENRRAGARQKALKVMMVRVSWIPGMVCTFWFT